MRGSESPFESLYDAIAFSSADWGLARDMAWIYGVVLGWDADEGEDDGLDAMGELSRRFGWNADEVARLRRLHSEFQRAAQAWQEAGR